MTGTPQQADSSRMYDLDVNGFGFVRFADLKHDETLATELSEPEKPWPEDITPSEPRTASGAEPKGG